MRDDRVWLERGCPDHGLVRTLYDEDPHILRYLEQWQAPTKQHVADSPDNFRPIPEAYAHGLPAMQTQHTCILLEDVIEHCNLRCPTCFTASGPQLRGVAPLDVGPGERGRPTVPGGRTAGRARCSPAVNRPSIRSWPTCSTNSRRRPIVRIMVNTNGLRVASDDALVALLVRHRERVEVYLQYDGPSPEASVHHRGADLTRFKEEAIAGPVRRRGVHHPGHDGGVGRQRR